MRHRARVLWLAKGLGRGGAERLLVGCAGHVAERFDVEVGYVLPWKDALVPELRVLGVPVHCLEGGREADLRWVWRLRRLLHERRYDIVHTHMPVPAVAARLLVAGRCRPRLVHTEHNVWSRYRGLTRWANATTYDRNAAVIAVSGSVAASIADGRPTRPTGPDVTVILHGIERQRLVVDPSARASARADLGAAVGDVVIGTVGNLTPKKDHQSLLLAHRALLDHGVATRLVLVGTGPLEASLRQRAAALGTHGRVVFAGSRDDVPRLLTAFDVFALSSVAEGLPVALMEAMATGLPCIATAVGGVPEILTDGVDGRLVPPSDVEALTGALAALATDAALRRRLAAAALARSSAFDVARAQRQVEAVYDRVLDRMPTRGAA